MMDPTLHQAIDEILSILEAKGEAKERMIKELDTALIMLALKKLSEGLAEQDRADWDSRAKNALEAGNEELLRNLVTQLSQKFPAEDMSKLYQQIMLEKLPVYIAEIVKTATPEQKKQIEKLLESIG